MEATLSSETSVYNKPTWRYIPEDDVIDGRHVGHVIFYAVHVIKWEAVGLLLGNGSIVPAATKDSWNSRFYASHVVERRQLVLPRTCYIQTYFDMSLCH
jgi:hypothetical protein